MTLSIHLTTEWSPEQFAPYGAAVTKAMHKLAERFPREVSVPHLAQEIMSGERQLWLILDGEEFVSFGLTEIRVEEATGLKTLLIPSFAGEEGQKAVHLISAVEEYGRQNGCDEILIWGRPGWKRAVAKEGYDMHVAIFRKAL